MCFFSNYFATSHRVRKFGASQTMPNIRLDNFLVTAKMVICVSVVKIKLHTAVIKYKIYFLSSRGNHDRDVIIAVTE